MIHPQHEALVILNSSLTTPQEFEVTCSELTVKQSISKRVFIVDADQADVERLCRLPGVVHAVGGELPPDAEVEHLTDAEALFIDAWSVRQQQVKQPRPGEDLPWDAAEFNPPG
ncbi:MAG: hypothetical protein AAF572_05915 [Cyanobacteria bacterium P01_B01_bin.77]